MEEGSGRESRRSAAAGGVSTREGRSSRKRAAEATPAETTKSSRRRKAEAAADGGAAAAGAGAAGGAGGAAAASHQSSSREGRDRWHDAAASTEPFEGKRTRSSLAAAEDEPPARASRHRDSGKDKSKDSGKDSATETSRARGGRRAEKQASASSASARSSHALQSAMDVSHPFAGDGGVGGDPFSGLRRLLGPGFDELPMAGGMLRGPAQRFRRLLDGLKAEGEIGRQMEALTELCEILCMATEETLVGFSVESFLPPLISLISCEASADVMLLACRAIAYVLDAIPGSSAAVVHFGSIAPLCAKLNAIEYIDVAEQALLTLHKISTEHAGQLLRASGVSAVLSYLDFFPISVQRTGMQTVSNMCKRVTADSIPMVSDSIPQLSDLLLHSDSKLAEYVCQAFCRLVTSLQGSKDLLEQVARHSLIPNAWTIVSNCLADAPAEQADKDKETRHLSFGTDLCAQLLQMLASLAAASPKLSVTILSQNDVGKVLRSKILVERQPEGAGEGASGSSWRRSSMEHSSRSSPQLLRALMALSTSLLPPLPVLPPPQEKEKEKEKEKSGKGAASKKGGGRRGKAQAATAAGGAPGAAGGAGAGGAGGAGAGAERGEQGAAQWKENSELLESFGAELVEAVLSMASLSIDSTIRLDSLSALCKLCHYMPNAKLHAALPRQQACELLAALLASDSLQSRFLALVLVHELMSKSPEEFHALFTREGIVHSLHRSLHEAKKQPPAPPAQPRREDKWPAALSSWSSRASALTRAAPPSHLPEVTEATFAAMLVYTCEKHQLAESGGASASSDGLTPVVKELQQLGSAMVKSAEQGDEEAAEVSLRGVVKLFEDSSHVSTFEMAKSDVCDNLIRFLSYKKEEKTVGRKTSKAAKERAAAESAAATAVLEKRWATFVSLVTQASSNTDGVTSPCQNLLLKLVAALNNSEGFVLGPQLQAAEAEGQWAKHSRIMFQPLRLRFQRSAGCSSSVKDYGNAVVIDPLASISAIHDFLWPRVGRHSREKEGEGSSVAEEAASSRASRSRGGDGARSSAGGSSWRTRGAGGAAAAEGAEAGGAAGSSARLSRAVYLESSVADAGEGVDSDEDVSEGERGDVGMEEMMAVPRPLGAGDEDEELDDEMDVDGGEGGADEGGGEMGRRVQVLDIQLAGEGPGEGAASAREGSSSARAAQRQQQQQQQQEGEDGKQRLALSIGGHALLQPSMSILEAVLLSYASSRQGSSSGSSSVSAVSMDSRAALWTTIHVVEYAPSTSRDRAAADASEAGGAGGGVASLLLGSNGSGLLPARQAAQSQPLKSRGAALVGSSEALGGASMERLGLPATTAAMLRLVAVLHSVNSDLPVDHPTRVSPPEMVVGNLSRKASSVIRDPLQLCMNKVPEWVKLLLSSFPYLLAHNVRRMYFDLQAFGLLRALKNTGRDGEGRERQGGGGVVQRQKVRVGREQLVESAKKVMQIYSEEGLPPSSMLEVEFSGEVGVGAGPTQEFFSSFCKELQRKALGLWWDEGSVPGAKEEEEGAEGARKEEEELARCSHGLFPAPLGGGGGEEGEAQRKKRLDALEVMGWVCAKAVVDGRLLDLPLSLPLCRALLGIPLEHADLRYIAPQVWRTMQELQGVLEEKRKLEAELSPEEAAKAVEGLGLGGVPLADLCIGFTVPGFDNVALREGGEEESLSVHNLQDFLTLLPQVILVSAVEPLLQAFRTGFSKVLSIDCLRLFCVEEVLEMFGSDKGLLQWTPDQLLHAFKFEHGYSSNSATARLLVEVLCELPLPTKRKFVSFCTGCPRLPVGGFGALRPALTVVRKESSRAPTEQQLPSVMTCANYLKLPEYLSASVLKDRLLVAVYEADGSFHLS